MPGGRRIRIVVIATLLGVAAVAGVTLLEIFVAGNRHIVIPGEIYRSAQPSPSTLRSWAEELGLRSVINLKGDTTGRNAARGEQARVSQEAGFVFHYVRMSAQRLPSRGELLDLIDAIESAERPTLLHCQAGIDRTGLASAIAILLADESPEVARRQFSLGFGYPGRLLGSELPDVIDAYGRWLADRGREHSPATLREWVEHDYIAYYYAADYELISGAEDLAHGRPATFIVRATNRSPQTIPLRCPQHGVELSLLVRELDVEKPYEMERRACGDALELAPEASIVFKARGFKLPRAGRYEMIVDLVDNERETYFENMGSPVLRVELRVN